MMSSRSATADGFSIFDEDRGARSPTSLRTSCTSLGTLHERQRDPVDTELQERARGRRWSLSVSGPIGRSVSGRQMPLRLDSMPPDEHLGRNAVGGGLDDTHAELAVVEQKHMTGRHRRKDLRVRQVHGVVAAGLLVAFEAEDRAVVDEHAAAVESRRRGTSGPAGRRGCRSGADGAPPPSGRSSAEHRAVSCEEWLMLMRNTSTPARNRRSIISVADEAGPKVATILTRLLRLISRLPRDPAPDR